MSFIVSLQLYAQPYPTTSYQLDEEGKTIVKWLGSEAELNQLYYQRKPLILRVVLFMIAMNSRKSLGAMLLCRLARMPSLLVKD